MTRKHIDVLYTLNIIHSENTDDNILFGIFVPNWSLLSASHKSRSGEQGFISIHIDFNFPRSQYINVTLITR